MKIIGSALKFVIYILTWFFIFSCNKDHNNPYDRDCPSNLWSPVSLKATLSETGIHITWEQYEPHFDGFVLEKSADSASWTPVKAGLIDKTIRDYSDALNSSSVKIYYRIFAKADKNISGTSYSKGLKLPNLATISTTAVTLITFNSASSGGNISTEGGGSVRARGICWSTNHNPTISDNKSSDGTGSGVFVSTISGLSNNTTYYVRAYATNIAGTVYGAEYPIILYMNVADANITDVDGNVYPTVKIGSQIWMQKNLATTKYNDGTPIPFVGAWALGGASPWFESDFYCWYNADVSNKAIYGALYDWYCINTGKLCPKGWHVPSDSEWTTLISYLGGENSAGDKMKFTAGWANDGNGSNSSGFCALPGGGSSNNGAGIGTGVMGWWWSSSSQHQLWYLTYESGNAFPSSNLPAYALSVRCLKD